ncbi:TPA_asm: hypothetical protein vir215_00027 [Ventrumvirus gergoviense]|uniref:Uncharacterized protein n=1 Tax=Caudoviricetes sp. vir215 TaxID=3068354 RepID=A0AA86YF38_9CAUD|nr:TPA_asm: hypothetical protein vir215_00027 [Caudoviricetes sp. vir215]
MTYIAIKVSNGVSLRRFWLLEDVFTEAAGVDVDVTISEHDGVWTYCDVDIDDGNDRNSIAAKRLVDYIENIPMGEILFDWDTMFEVACEDCEEEDDE